MGGELELRVRSDASIGRGQLRVEASSAEGSVLWLPALMVGKQRYELKTGTTTVGRAEGGADIAIDDRGLSRIHFEIAWNGNVAALRDRQSTNGTFIDGARVNELVLHSGTKIEAGRTEFEFELRPVSSNTERGGDE
jgi:pSer/pThr/pTyr-binding forkhead associated (FHA) protein